MLSHTLNRPIADKSILTAIISFGITWSGNITVEKPDKQETPDKEHHHSRVRLAETDFDKVIDEYKKGHQGS